MNSKEKYKTITKLWLDESGDSGFKFGQGSSQFLVITAVYSLDNNEMNIQKEIDKLKSQLKLTEDYEFKFSRCKNIYKKEFLNTILDLPISYKSIFVNKAKLKTSALRFSPHQLYCELVRRLLYDNNPPLEKAVLNIDEAAAKIHHREFNMVLKKYLSKNLVNKIRQKRSKNETMIQAADMVGGSIFRKFEKNDDSYHEIVKPKEAILIEF